MAKDPEDFIFIDPPGPWDPIAEWERHLVELKTLPDTAMVRLHIREAEEHIEKARRNPKYPLDQ